MEENEIQKLVNELNERNQQKASETKKFVKPRPEPDVIITRYRILIERSVFWSARQAYLELFKSFLSKKIGGETFRTKFFRLKGQNVRRTYEICNKIEGEIDEKIEEEIDLYYTSKATDFSRVIGNLYFEIDQYEPDIDDWDWNEIVYSESKLRSVILENYLPIIQKSCDLDDSLFHSKIDLDRLIERSYQIFFWVALAASGFLLVNLI